MGLTWRFLAASVHADIAACTASAGTMMERIGGCAQGQMSQRGGGNLWTETSGRVALDSSVDDERIILQLLAIDLVVLRGSDLPLTIALQPGIGPDLALLRVGMRFVFADGVLAAVNDGHVFARRRKEKRTLASSSAQPCAECGPFSSRSSSALL